MPVPPMASAKLPSGVTAIVPLPSYPTAAVSIVETNVAVEICTTKMRDRSASPTKAWSLPKYETPCGCALGGNPGTRTCVAGVFASGKTTMRLLESVVLITAGC